MIAALQPWMVLAGVAVLALWILYLAIRLRRLAGKVELLQGKDEDRERELDVLQDRIDEKGAWAPPDSSRRASAIAHRQRDCHDDRPTARSPTSVVVDNERAQAPRDRHPDSYEAPEGVVMKTAYRYAGEIAAAYNELVSDFSPESLDAFRGKWDPVAVTAMGQRQFAADDSGKLWFVPEKAGAAHGALLPGPEVIRLWAKFYRKMSGLDAKTLLGGLYEIHEGPSLSVHRPATASREGASFHINEPGELSGI